MLIDFCSETEKADTINTFYIASSDFNSYKQIDIFRILAHSPRALRNNNWVRLEIENGCDQISIKTKT